MAEPIHNFLFEVTHGPTFEELMASVPTPEKPRDLPARGFSVNMCRVEDGSFIRQLDLNFRIEAVLPDFTKGDRTLGSRWCVYGRWHGGSLYAALKDHMRYMAAFYDPTTKTGPARFDRRSLIEYPGMMDPAVIRQSVAS